VETSQYGRKKDVKETKSTWGEEKNPYLRGKVGGSAGRKKLVDPNQKKGQINEKMQKHEGGLEQKG